MNVGLLLVSLLILLLPFGQLLRVSLPDSPEIAIQPADLVAFLLFIYSVYQLVIQRIKPPLLKSLTLFIGVCVVSLVVNWNTIKLTELSLSSLYVVRFILYSSVYVAVFYFAQKYAERL